MPDFLSEAQSLFEYTQSLRRDFHMHPELGFHEVRTAGIVAKELNALDMEVTTGVAKTGVVGMLEGGKPGPVVLDPLRYGRPACYRANGRSLRLDQFRENARLRA